MTTSDELESFESFEEDSEEDSSGGGPNAKPWDPSKIRIDTKNFTLREVGLQIQEGELDLAPDFQRDYVWKARQQTRLIESVLLGIPLPAFYFNQERERLQVVDGVQRLTTISNFMRGEFRLELGSLEYLKDLSGKTFSELDPQLQRRFSKTQIVVHVIEPQTPDGVKYDIFSRVNTGGSPLSAQEIRHAMSKAPSRNFLKQLVDLPSFSAATGGWFLPINGGNRRMMDRELALRFCAFCVTPLDEYRTYESLDSFLLAFTRKIDSSDRAIDFDHLARSFDTAMKNAFTAFDKSAFRRRVKGRRSPLNRAVFEAQAIALADKSPPAVTENASALKAAFATLLDQEEFSASVTVGTGDSKKVKTRLEQAAAAVRSVLG